MLAAIPSAAWIIDAESGECLDRNEAAARCGSHPKQGGSSRDVTYRGRAARLIVDVVAHEEQLRDLIDGSADIIYESDADGRFTFVNAAVTRLLGYSADEVLGKRYTDLIPLDWRETVVNHYREQFRSRAASTYFEFPCLDKNGRIIWVGQRVQPIIKDARITGFRSIARDITDRRIAEDSRREFEQRFHSFMSHSPVVAFLKESDGRFVYVNDEMERVFGRQGHSLIGTFDDDLFAEGTSIVIRTNDHEVLRTNEPVKILEMIPDAQGVPRQWLVYKFPVRAGQQTLIGGVAVDLSDRLQLEAKLSEARDAALASAKMKSEFLATMSHEIRTPMNGVLGMLGLLVDTNLNADQRELLTTARSSAESLLTIINDILDFSKIEAGKMTFEKASFDLRPTVDAVVDLVGDTARRKNLDLGCVIDNNVPRSLRGDAGRLRQILLNLIGNAVKFTTDGGVVVRVSRQEEADDSVQLLFRIIDTGIGIDAAHIRHLFEPFTQADATTTRRFGGTGLGLAISKKLVEMMDGEIGCESEPGGGSTFWFTARFGKVAALTGVEAGKKAPNVLIADDSATSRQLLSLQLSSWGVPHTCAIDGLDGLSLARKAADAGQPFNIVLSDLRMPQLDGAALARFMKADPRLGSPQFILMTSSSDDDAIAGSAGIDMRLQKPLKHRQLFCALFGEEPEAEHAVVVNATTTDSAKSDRSKVRLLVVEDNAVNQKVALRMLQKLGYAADAVANGLEAVEAVRRIPYDLVFMDCHMPEMDGFQATEEIRRFEKGIRRTPIVALTASAQESDRDRCLTAGMDDFVTKPVRLEALGAAIEKWLCQREEELQHA